MLQKIQAWIIIERLKGAIKAIFSSMPACLAVFADG
jgi:hypothetical protein